MINIKDRLSSFYKELKEDYPNWIFDNIPGGWKINFWYINTRRLIISKYQTITKGYADEETWSLDVHMAKWILPRLKHLRNNLHSTPPNLELDETFLSARIHCVTPEKEGEGSGSLSIKEWEEKLDKMIFAFDYVANNDDYEDQCYPEDFQWGMKLNEKGIYVSKDSRKPDFSKMIEWDKKYKEGINLFSLYFRHLWD